MSKITSGKREIPIQGLFPPQSMVWQVNQDVLILTGGLRALVMQIAHPLIAQGVVDHSRFQQDPIGRLRRTLEIVLALAFGDREMILRALEYLQRIHIPVTGELNEETGNWKVRRAYSAEDQPLRFWVFATLVESSLSMYELLFKRLSEPEKDQYYQENLQIAELLNINIENFPDRFRSFEAYFQTMIYGDKISIGDNGKKLATDIFHPQLKYVPRLFHFPVKWFTIGLLPPILRQKFGWRWHFGHRIYFRAVLLALKMLIWLTPQSLRSLPSARLAQKRWNNTVEPRIET